MAPPWGDRIYITINIQEKIAADVCKSRRVVKIYGNYTGPWYF